ncbi:hypothetical protein K505DRAFT_340387 [Melanomma pulvis-pyrius CBS 109.77]|uniref:Uncharacterized protein n=1 Tax=Melanomma pulvis-pyrius CBS 109.77 TaxID=1314802 RepID=A0A6A6X2A4_9PLEO|nr:hypothetical protein K505DRAFT_340387 [Melanomma pulvis-pyrius CBS 109.77]
MMCDPKAPNNPFPLGLNFLKDIGDDLLHYREQCASTYSLLRKLVIGELILNSSKLSDIEIQAKELEAATFIERLEATLSSYRDDLDKISVDVLQDLALAGGASEKYTREWAPMQKRKEEDHYAFVLGALAKIKPAFEEGKKNWPALKDILVEKHGLEALMRDSK